MTDTHTVTYRINKISRLSYSIETRPSNFLIERDDCEFTLTLALIIPQDFEGIVIQCDIICLDKRNREKLLKFITENKFDVVEYQKVIGKTDDGRFTVPDNLLVEAISLSIGAARGMLVLSNAGTYLNEAVLPIFNPVHILENLKSSTTQVNPASH